MSVTCDFKGRAALVARTAMGMGLVIAHAFAQNGTSRDFLHPTQSV